MLITILYFIPGYMWPIQAMPKILFYIARYLVFTTYPVQCFSDIIQKRFDLEQKSIWIGIAYLIVSSLIFILLAFKLLKKKKFFN